MLEKQAAEERQKLEDDEEPANQEEESFDVEGDAGAKGKAAKKALDKPKESETIEEEASVSMHGDTEYWQDGMDAFKTTSEDHEYSLSWWSKKVAMCSSSK